MSEEQVAAQTQQTVADFKRILKGQSKNELVRTVLFMVAKLQEMGTKFEQVLEENNKQAQEPKQGE